MARQNKRSTRNTVDSLTAALDALARATQVERRWTLDEAHAAGYCTAREYAQHVGLSRVQAHRVLADSCESVLLVGRGGRAYRPRRAP